eukprot:g1605.t1
MPWGYYHKQAVKQENKEKLAGFITDTRHTMSKLNGDITYYKTSQRLDNERNQLPKTLAKATDVPRDLRPDLTVGDIRDMGRALSNYEKLKKYCFAPS